MASSATAHECPTHAERPDTELVSNTWGMDRTLDDCQHLNDRGRRDEGPGHVTPVREADGVQ